MSVETYALIVFVGALVLLGAYTLLSIIAAWYCDFRDALAAGERCYRKGYEKGWADASKENRDG